MSILKFKRIKKLWRAFRFRMLVDPTLAWKFMALNLAILGVLVYMQTCT